MDPLSIASRALGALRVVRKPLALILLLAAIWLHGHATGAGSANQRWEFITARAEARHSQELADAQAKAREVEQGWMGAYAELAGQMQKEKESVEAHRDRLLAAARSGGLRLPSCPAATGLPGPAPGAAGGDAAAGGELPAAPRAAPDLAEFLIHEAARADGIAAQLAACQEAHRAIRPR